MFLNLIVTELEYLQFVRECTLCGLCFSKVVNNLAVRESLFDVLVVEVDDSVAIRERFSFNTVVEDDLFLSVLVDALDFAILADVLLCNFLVCSRLAVVLLWILKTIVFFIFFCIVKVSFLAARSSRSPGIVLGVGLVLGCPLEIQIDRVLHFSLHLFRVILVSVSAAAVRVTLDWITYGCDFLVLRNGPASNCLDKPIAILSLSIIKFDLLLVIN